MRLVFELLYLAFIPGCLACHTLPCLSRWCRPVLREQCRTSSLSDG
jgi:hypothetical protein